MNELDYAIIQLVQSIDPSRTYDECSRRTDEAFNTFAMPPALVTDYWQFEACMMCLIEHLDRHILRLHEPVPIPYAIAWGRCLSALTALYGPNGDKAAFEMSRTGVEAALYGVLKAVAAHIGKEYAENEVKSRVWSFWNDLTIEARLVAGDAYLRHFGHLLPSDLTEGSAARVRANLPRFLIEHAGAVQKMREANRAKR